MTPLLFVAAYYAYCVLYFWIVQRTAFCLYNRRSNPEGGYGRGVLRQIYGHGLRTDLVGAVYFTALPVLLATAWLIAGADPVPAVRVYTVVLAVIAGLAAAADMLLYRFWQSKIDASVLRFLRSVDGAVASVSPRYLLGAGGLWALFGGLFYAGAAAVIRWTLAAHPWTAQTAGEKGAVAGAALGVLAVLFAILRGVKHRPKSPSISYFSTNMYYNHCAVNAVYNFIFSISAVDSLGKKFRFCDPAEAAERMAACYPTAGTPQEKLLRTDRPNVLLVIWESLSARHFAPLGGQPGVTVNLERLAAEGVLFTRCYAGSTRTDRGLPCILSGYPSPTASSVIKYTRKLPQLPSLPRSLKEAGYVTEAWHGGQMDYNRKRDYYMALGFDRLVEQSAFPADAPAGKWGVHDGFVFERLRADLEAKQARGERWFTSFQTLSSHEDFRVPYERIPDDAIANSFAYVDEAFGRFVDSLRQTPVWENLLIVVTGDHGLYYGPGIARQAYPHIPLLLLGGALRAPRRIETVTGQTDMAATLLGQLGIGHGDFPFSRDVLADTYTQPFAVHTCPSGFIVHDPEGFTDFDLSAGRAITGPDPFREAVGKLTLQQLFADLDKR